MNVKVMGGVIYVKILRLMPKSGLINVDKKVPGHLGQS
jgi:hypothetical protein